MTILDSYIAHAANRGPVLYRHPKGYVKQASLVYWPRSGPTCRLQLDSGSFVRVRCDLVDLVLPAVEP